MALKQRGKHAKNSHLLTRIAAGVIGSLYALGDRAAGEM